MREMSMMKQALESAKIVKMQVVSESPKESELCVINVTGFGPPGKQMPCMLMWGYIEGAWRWLGMTINSDWRPEAKAREAWARNVLKEAEK